ncbi:hypothetical protein [Falsihalocynthiibacter arcticus]|uniref:Uncharacterized protein n=1 Tax=Falsihalocynthiibacter arcticus TaxID=1579316 RepID=A0A126V6L7_9RHOB|nr:hypothetical protein [Falsihalocynthiibacter arcticus]AML53797.1 hypothetical protein RC74_21320 [Falsihalocynthiibacter arcticus]
MTKILFALGWLFSLSVSALAQVQPDEKTTQFVANVSETFLDQLVKEDFATERAFMTDQLAAHVSDDDWRSVRLQVIETAGRTQRYIVHGMMYYQEENLLAAVDFSGWAETSDTLVCGFMLWELPEENVIGLARFEQNVVSVDVFRRMPTQKAAKTMTNWRCPAKMIESLLGISVQ